MSPWYYAALFLAIIAAAAALGHAGVIAAAAPGSIVVTQPSLFSSERETHRVSCWRDGKTIEERVMMVDRDLGVDQYRIEAGMIRMAVPADDKFNGGFLFLRIDGCITQKTQRE